MKEKEYLEVSLERVKDIIDSFEKDEFKTTEVIKRYLGGFYSNKETPPYYSLNAQFGKLLQRNSKKLEIKEIKANVNTQDDLGNPTTTSIWKSN